MLKGINPILNGEMLLMLDQMGHGEELALVDRNFPAYSYDKPVLEVRSLSIAEFAPVLFSVFPLDPYSDLQIRRMAFQDDPDAISDATKALHDAAIASNGDASFNHGAVGRFDFYEEAKKASLFILTGETIGYSDYLIPKGVV